MGIFNFNKWKTIPGYETHEMNDEGYVRVKKTKKILKLRPTYQLWNPKTKSYYSKVIYVNSFIKNLFPKSKVKLTPKPVIAKIKYESGTLENEIWKDYNSNYKISNYGRMYSNHYNRVIKPIVTGYQYFYHLKTKSETLRFSVRKELPKFFKKSELMFDCDIPPKKMIIGKINSGKIGVYNFSGKGHKPWRYVIQFKGRYYAGYYKTEKEAKQGWLEKYCELYKIEVPNGI